MKKYPLLHNQERMWFEWKLNPEKLAYNTLFLFRLNGKLHEKALEQALNFLSNRHEVLRTCYVEEKNVPYQIVLDKLNVEFQKYDLTSLPESKKESAYQQLIDQRFFIPFNLKQSPPHRYIYIRLTENTSILGFSWHHILIDATSVEIFLKELSFVYHSLIADKEIHFPTQPSSLQEIIDFEAMQKDEKGILFWKEQLSYADLSLLLPKTNQYLKQEKRMDRRTRHALSQDLTHKLMQVVSKTESSLFAVLMSALQALLYRYTNQKEFTIGYSANIRKNIHKNSIGFFVNNLPLIARVDEHTTFCDLISQIRANRQFETVPLNKIIQEIRKERETPSHSLFNVQVNQSSYLSFALNIEGVQAEPIHITDIDAENHLTIRYDHFKNIELECDYRTEFLSSSFIQDFVKNYKVVLEQMAACLHTKIHHLHFLDEFEINKRLKEWNSTQEVFETPNTLHELFEEQVQKTPLNLAVVSHGASITYRDLNQSANQLACCLKQKGITREDFVAVIVPPSIEMLIAILGILKAGAAYVPIDPDTPETRITYIIKDTGAKIVLTPEKISELFLTPGLSGTFSESNPLCISQPKDLAYVIYTSGSTGAPKGVMVEHRSCVNYINWCKKTYPLGSGETLPLVSSFAFDMSITSLFLPLVVGKTIALNEDNLTQPFYNACLVKMTPSHIKRLSHPQNCLKAITFVIGGEELKWEDVCLLRKMYPNALIYNEYGPTEAAVACSIYQIDPQTPLNNIPIGKPISNVELYILDESLNPLPVGFIGELYIGGIGVARGYLNQPMLTQEKFIPNHLNSSSEFSLYKTGDLARFLPDGNIEFLGRKDAQVKIKGFRVELKEIESILKQHADIKDAIVIKGLKDSLVAYFISHDFHPEAAELNSFLKMRLPYYMIPEAFIQLESFPLTPNGKLDYRALPSPLFESKVNQDETLPENEIEKEIAKIWSHLLQKVEIKKHDHFFKLGGHSLLAIQCISQIRSRFNIEISLKTLFEFPTLALLADYVSNQPKQILPSIPKRVSITTNV